MVTGTTQTNWTDAIGSFYSTTRKITINILYNSCPNMVWLWRHLLRWDHRTLQYAILFPHKIISKIMVGFSKFIKYWDPFWNTVFFTDPTCFECHRIKNHITINFKFAFVFLQYWLFFMLLIWINKNILRMNYKHPKSERMSVKVAGFQNLIHHCHESNSSYLRR